MKPTEETIAVLAQGPWQRVVQRTTPAQIAQALVEDLNQQFGYEFRLDPSTIDAAHGDGVAFAWAAGFGPVGLARALLRLYVAIATQDAVVADAIVFVFVGGRRVAPKGKDFLGYSFDPARAAGARWTHDGWCDDEFGEYTDIDHEDALR